MLDTDRVADSVQSSDPDSGYSSRGFSAALASGSGAIAAIPPLLLGSPVTVCTTLALAMFAAVGLASILI